MKNELQALADYAEVLGKEGPNCEAAQELRGMAADNSNLIELFNISDLLYYALQRKKDRGN